MGNISEEVNVEILQGRSEWRFSAIFPVVLFNDLYWLTILAYTAEEEREIIPTICMYIAIGVLVPFLYPSLVPFIPHRFSTLVVKYNQKTPDVNCENIICKYTKIWYNNKYMVYK